MTADNFEPKHKDMGHHVASGILNAGIAQMVKVLCQFGSVIILSRLLPPSDFGVVAMTGPVYSFVMLFQDLGLGQATIQKPQIGHDEINAFFWINVGVGAVLATLLVALGPVAGWYYGDHRVVSLTAAMGLLVLFSALGTQHGAILQRRMEFRTSALLDALATLSGLGVSIVCAVIIKGYWALYFGMAAGTVVPVIGVWLIVRWRPSAPRLPPGTRDMLKFGAGITGSNLMNFLARNTDNILIGRSWGDRELGFYDRAYKLLLFPLQRIVFPIANIMIPVLSRLVNEPDRYRSIFLRTLSQVTLAVWPGIMWAILLSDSLIPAVLGKNWINSAPMFRPLALAGLLQILNGSATWLFISQGRSGDLARWASVNAATCIAAFVIGLPYGAVGVAIAYAVSECLRAPFLWWYVTRRGAVKPTDVLRAVLPQALSVLVSGLALFVFRKFTQLPIVFLLAGGVILSYGTAALTMGLFSDGRETLKQTIGIARQLLLRLVSRDTSPT